MILYALYDKLSGRTVSYITAQNRADFLRMASRIKQQNTNFHVSELAFYRCGKINDDSPGSLVNDFDFEFDLIHAEERYHEAIRKVSPDASFTPSLEEVEKEEQS